MKRRLLAALAGWALVLLWATPAAAVNAVNITQAPKSGEVTSGSQTIRAEARSGVVTGLLETVTIEVTVVPQGGGSAISLGSKQTNSYEATWNVGAAPLNGGYDIVAHATSNMDSTGAKATVSGVLVNNPPAAPSGVKATLKDGVPVVTWTANTEADTIGYRILRNDSQLTQLNGRTTTTFSDGQAPQAQSLTYRVVAVRKSPVASTGIASGPSAASQPITIPAPAAPEAPEPAAEGGEPAAEGGEPAAEGGEPTVPGTNIVTGEETPPPAPATNPNFGQARAPIVRGGPAVTEFESTLPYTGTPPERFSAAGDGATSPLDAAEAGDAAMTVTNPAKFIAGGIVLLAVSFLLWKTSRKMLRGLNAEDDPSPNAVDFPAFKVNRILMEGSAQVPEHPN